MTIGIWIELHYAECHTFYIVMLSVVMLSVIMMSVMAPRKVPGKKNPLP